MRTAHAEERLFIHVWFIQHNTWCVVELINHPVQTVLHRSCVTKFLLMHVFMCLAPGYREIVTQSLPQISVLDGLDPLGNSSDQGLVSPCDVPTLENYVDLLLSSDTSHNEVVILFICFYFCQHSSTFVSAYRYTGTQNDAITTISQGHDTGKYELHP